VKPGVDLMKLNIMNHVVLPSYHPYGTGI